MKGMKGKMMKKLKASANKPIGYLNPDRILQVSNFDGIVDNLRSKCNVVDKFPFKSKHEKPVKTDVLEEVKRDIADQKKVQEVQEKENVSPLVCEDEICDGYDGLSEIDVTSFRRPDMDSGSLFDPKLLAVFRYHVSEHIKACEAAATAADVDNEVKSCDKKHKYPFFQPDSLSESDDQPNPLLEFEDKRPPGGDNSVIFYTTTLRGIRKTFEDCQSIRFLLESFGVVFYERDVSIHSEFREELWRVMRDKVLPPRLFIRGRYIGGADRVLTLHEQGRLRVLFRDIPIDFSEGPCNVCCGLRFMLCYTCNGSRKVFEQDDQEGSTGGIWSKCLQCNENGLVVCPLC